ncbi:hypothetical protein [Prosthecobacter sp.]|uniref:hypothetical protein n=1 Tax=Prosthecobacter sp. TaxID=1965333 RepID=UPI002AB98091|nr:hypothetical protein [Prosthecobacter sp.]MDZ4404037.1 hypothetical protein [Prosthecobacter sp.]
MSTPPRPAGDCFAPIPGKPVYRRYNLEGKDSSECCEKLIVSVHGMGDQTRNDMTQIVARLFAECAKSGGDLPAQARNLPMSLWEGGNDYLTDDAIAFVSGKTVLDEMAFAEFHWADLPRKLETECYRLEEPTKWARSVVERLSQRHNLTDKDKFGTHGPELAASVLEEIAETIRLLNQLLFLAGKAGVFNFDLGILLERYLCDVQQVADFMHQRKSILDRFLKRMTHLHSLCPTAEIHLVAHSEGSVVALYGLLKALNPQSLTSPERKDSKNKGGETKESYDLTWLEKVRSLTTFGSPIDKHLILWPEMWFSFKRDATHWNKPDPSSPEQRIRWRNYYDLADPVGYGLDTARCQLKAWGCEAFEFEPWHDQGFRRYPLPGKAHVDYFGDTKLFQHIWDHAIKEPAASDKPIIPPKLGNTWKGRLSPFLPFLIVALLHVAAVFVLHKAIVVHPEEAMKQAGLTGLEGMHSPATESSLGILGCAALLLGTTVLARTWRITRDWRLPRDWQHWQHPGDFVARVVALLVFVLGLTVFWQIPGFYTAEIARKILFGTRTWSDVLGDGLGVGEIRRITTIVFGTLAVVVLIIACVADWWSLKKQKRPIWGLRWLMLLGGGGTAALMVSTRIGDNHPETSMLALFGGAIGFVYLWWLGALLYDLSYVWMRYINTTYTLLDRVSSKTEKFSDESIIAPDGSRK